MLARSNATPLDPVRFSDLKRMNESALHFKEGGGGLATMSMEKGTGLHAYLLGGADKIAVYEDGARNAKHAKYREFQAENAGKHILIPSQLAAVEGMRKRVEANDDAMDLLEGIQESRITWSTLGRACAGTPDCVRVKNGRKIGVELKATRSSKPERFFYQARNSFYHGQCAWYRDGMNKTTAYGPDLLDCEEFYVIAVEMTKPYPVTVFQYDERSLDAGHRKNMLWLERLLNCERSDFFPPYTQSIVPLSCFEDRDEGESRGPGPGGGDDGLDWGGIDEAAAE